MRLQGTDSALPLRIARMDDTTDILATSNFYDIVYLKPHFVRWIRLRRETMKRSRFNQLLPETKCNSTMHDSAASFAHAHKLVHHSSKSQPVSLYTQHKL
mmetsp:Transcript_10495/g.17690  ORF Transcript_10495/g.17690 Transcript_10495/m.17690 type:complete len:100 (+) Transcript_10495:513-812(+)